jgi:hypothetical protein
MSSDLAHEAVPPLAWDHQGLPFQPPPETIAWKVREYTGKPGRPGIVWDGTGPMHVELETTMQDFRKMVEPGSYRLYPVDQAGNELAPIACIEVVPEEDGEPRALARVERTPAVVDDELPALAAPGRIYDILERMIASRDAHDALLASMLTTMVQSTAAIQQSTAALLQAANTTVKVANGTTRPEPPDIDIEELSERLSELVTPPEQPAKPNAPWFVQLLSGPLGAGLMQFAHGFMQSVAVAQQAKAQASQPAQPVAQPAQSAAQPAQAAPQAAPSPAQPRPAQHQPNTVQRPSAPSAEDEPMIDDTDFHELDEAEADDPPLMDELTDEDGDEPELDSEPEHQDAPPRPPGPDDEPAGSRARGHETAITQHQTPRKHRGSTTST